ncbi:MAG: glycosyltransferase family 2 protein [Armatimonadetes bacterium]|nr:glycosyltransferase family 2 protein [Armatimonadota bacterium]MDW8152901.1 glycosyltransferase family 2 protein [Armatimonadota bacterium]
MVDLDAHMGLKRSLTAFFPAYNEEGNIERTVRRALEVLPAYADVFEVIVVDDGSTDRTAEVVRRLMEEDPRVRLVQHDRNRGYGAALRTGFAAARYEWVFFSDADLQFDLADLGRLLPFTERGDLVVGYRLRRRDPFHRRLIGRAWNLLVRWAFGVRVRDVDCAFKLLRREVVQRLPLRSDGAFISTELLCRAAAAGARIAEVGVPHYPRRWGRQGGASLRVILRALQELWRLWRDLRRASAQGQAASTPAAPGVGARGRRSREG